MKNFFFGIAGLAIFLTACIKESERAETDFCTDGYIYWGGDPAVDGNGWYFSTKTDRSLEYPLKEVPDSLATDGLPVNLCLQKTNEQFFCHCPDRVYYHTILSAVKK